MNKSVISAGSSNRVRSGPKRSLEEELNLRMKDTYASPSIGLKYTHEKLLDKYNKSTLGAKQDKYREILEKIKEKARPMDHEMMKKHEMEYVSHRMKEREVREEEIRQRVFA